MTDQESSEWKELLDFLSTLGHAEEEPGRIALHLPDPPRTLQIVITPEELGGMAGTYYGSFESAREGIQELISRLEEEEGFLVYSQYRLWPQRKDPEDPVPDVERMIQHLREHSRKRATE